MKGVLRRISLLFGMRLHSMILASSELTPVIGLAYQPKVHHYFRAMQIPERSLGFEHFDEDRAAEHVRAGWRDRQSLKQHLHRRIPVLQAEALKPARLIAALDRGEDLDSAFARISASPVGPSEPGSAADGRRAP
jgi:polysaccharide pyruvyl transferase WcaK-like protein